MTTTYSSGSVADADAAQTPGDKLIARSISGRECAPVPFFERRRRFLILAFAWLLAASIALDYSIYAGGLAHLYLHEAATATVAILGLREALRRRAWLPAAAAIWIPLALLAFLGLDTIVTAAVHYPSVPAGMRKLFWFEHGDAIRILGALFIWLWSYGQLNPTRDESASILNIVLWAGAVLLVITGGSWLINGTAHTETTTFDLTAMIGEPLALALTIQRRARPVDLIRLSFYGGACLLLYSRTASPSSSSAL